METVQPISQPTEFNTSSRKKGKKKGLIVTVIVILLLAAGVFGYSKMQSGSADTVSPTPEMTTPTEEPTPTESVEVSPTPEAKETPEPTKKVTPTPKEAATKASELNIQVLNGSGAEGIATTAKDFLSGKGYKFIETGNGDNFDYEGVTLKSKSSVADYVADLKTDLEEKYKITTESDTLSEDSTFDVVIIVGK